MTRKSQQELEQPAKVYQLDAVDSKVDDAIKLLNQILDQTKGVATQADLATTKAAIIKDLKEHVANEVEQIHLEYRPFKKGGIAVAIIVITATIGQLVYAFFKSLFGAE